MRNTAAALAALIATTMLAGCARTSQQACADQGFTTGTPAFDQCVTVYKRKLAAAEAAQDQHDLAVRRAGASIAGSNPTCLMGPASGSCNGY